MNPIHSAILAVLPHRSLPPLAEAYRKLKGSLENSLEPDNEILDILDVLEKRPQSGRFQDALLEELEAFGAGKTPEILQAAQDLLDALKLQAAKAGTATIDIENIEAAGVHIKKLLAEGANAVVRVKGVKAKKDAVVNGLGAKSVTSKSGKGAASSVAKDIQAGRDVNLIQNTTTYVGGKPQRDPKALLRNYLQHLFELTRQLYLTGIDRKAAGNKQDACLDLGAVYIALNTVTVEREEGIQALGKMPDTHESKEPVRRSSALEQLNKHEHLVLLGDPGSGKSTFVHFVAMCLAGELLKDSHANLRRLSVPPPEEAENADDSEQKKAVPQQWRQGRKLPVLVVLRDFAAWLRQSKQQRGAAALWQFIRHILQERLLGDFAPYLGRYLEGGKVLLLLDGFDEVPESEERREQLKGIVEAFVKRFPQCRVLLTSRTYAYQRQDWQLQGFAESVLAPFSKAQIQQFVEQWYAHFAEMRGITEENARGQAELLKHAILESARLLDFAERPLLLTLMASLHAWRSGSLPEKREELYSDAVELLLDWWESPKLLKDAGGKMIVSEQSLTELLKVGKARVRKSLNALAFQVHHDQQELVGTADISAGILSDRLMQVSQNKELRPAYLIDYLSERAGLLVARGVGIYCFPHRSFQEYLAACYLTDDNYPKKLAALAKQEPERWREVLLLAGAKAARGAESAIWLLAENLCGTEFVAGSAGVEASWGALLAGQALAETADLDAIECYDRPKLDRVVNWLVAIVQEQAPAEAPLPALERTLAGRLLAALGDPRPGIGLHSPPGRCSEPAEERGEGWVLPDIEWCDVPQGRFLMGSDSEKDSQAYSWEQPQHEVFLSAYAIGRYPVTNAQYQAFVADGGYSDERWRDCWREGGWEWKQKEKVQGPAKVRSHFLPGNHPVVGVSWYEALAFCAWLTVKFRDCGKLDGEQEIRLPSEAEWERAARGEDGRIYPWGDNPIEAELANYTDTGLGATNAVGCFPRGKSPYDCEEMSGNVWEWCWDWFDDEYYQESPKKNPMGPASGSRRVSRGGSWAGEARYCRAACRNYWRRPGGRNDGLGFRLLRT